MATSIPHDMLTEILTCMPAKSIAKLRATNKHVASTTSSNSFSLSQANRCRHDAGFFVQTYSSAELFFLDSDAGVPCQFLKALRTSGEILASSNGLVFCKSNNEAADECICVYNPARKTQRLIPPPFSGENLREFQAYIRCLSVMYDGGMSPDYRLVLVLPTKEWGSQVYMLVFESKQDLWRDKKAVDAGLRSTSIRWKSSVVFGENIFWVSDCTDYIKCDPYILALNLESEKTRLISLPQQALATSDLHNCKIQITKWDDASLCFVQYNKLEAVFTLWVTKINELALDWKVVKRVGHVEIGLSRNDDIDDFTLINDDSLVVIMGYTIYTYNLRYEILKKVEKAAPGGILLPYANTLRPCGKFELKIEDSCEAKRSYKRLYLQIVLFMIFFLSMLCLKIFSSCSASYLFSFFLWFFIEVV